MDTKQILTALQQLKPDELRQRLRELDAETKAIRVILRSAIARESCTNRREVTSA